MAAKKNGAASSATSSMSTLDLIDQTTLISLFSTVAILGAAWGLSKVVLDKHATSNRTRFLFIWHAFDALIHFVLEGSFVYHCLFSTTEVRNVKGDYWPDPENYLGRIASGGRATGSSWGGLKGAGSRWVSGAQAGGEGSWMAKLWMVYSRADRRWAGVDLTVVSIEIITVTFAGAMAVLACYDIAKRNPRKNLVMIILATAEIYGGYMTFMPEWLSGNSNLDTSNFMFKWIFLVFFNGLWVVIPAYAIYVASKDISHAFAVRESVARKSSGRDSPSSSVSTVVKKSRKDKEK